MLTRALSQLRTWLHPYPWVLPSIAVLGTVAALAEGVSIGLMIPFLASMIGDDPTGNGLVARFVEAYASHFPEDIRLAVVGVSIVVLVVLSCAISYGYLRLLSWAATRVTHDLRASLFRRFFETNDSFVASGSQGRRMKAIDGAAYRSGQAVISFCLLITSGCTAAVFSVLLILISWSLTLMVLGGVAVVGLIVRFHVKRSMGLSASFEQNSARVSDTAMQVLSALRMVRVFGQENREAAEFEMMSEAVRHSEFRLETIRRSMGPLIDGMTVPILIGTLVIAFYDGVSAAILMPFLFLVFRLQRYVREFDQSHVRLAADTGAILEVASLLQPVSEKDRLPQGGQSISEFRDAIDFGGVSFTYDSAEDARAPSLADLSLRIPRGQVLGIVGPSGSGKSTLIDILIGLKAPTTGRVEVDGVDLCELDMGQWRRLLGFAGQDAELRAGTIAENIAYGDPSASIEAIRDAAAQADILGFIDRLPDGFDTAVGARGLQLSGGERQRIALARALLRKPQVLILDEATNAVDNNSEAAILNTLEALKGSITMIVIAHRLSSIRIADCVAVLSEGRIVEIGTPAELLARDGAFARLSHQRAAE